MLSIARALAIKRFFGDFVSRLFKKEEYVGHFACRIVLGCARFIVELSRFIFWSGSSWAQLALFWQVDFALVDSYVQSSPTQALPTYADREYYPLAVRFLPNPDAAVELDLPDRSLPLNFPITVKINHRKSATANSIDSGQRPAGKTVWPGSRRFSISGFKLQWRGIGDLSCSGA